MPQNITRQNDYYNDNRKKKKKKKKKDEEEEEEKKRTLHKKEIPFTSSHIIHFTFYIPLK